MNVGSSYFFATALTSLPEDGFAMLGSRKQLVMMIPSQRTVLVRLGWSRGDSPMEQNYRRILDEF
ncbi:hypothetical protein ST37_06585 [Vibrio sp. qd031]|uniref:hypothetical protein n=1 Tax=Vibrio sp. qd031 TaxID=1603038 RepID=UPI000A119974|nr:hypothetical protein [Vibrio sp. qd031]ORT51041.1 hypothetical protein ST37_06585 [Vibrio sp. qd031]